jgi:hypothetical protein
MAFPNQLVETVAGALGISPKTVAQHDRILASNGYRKIGGRGRNANVTILDAANLIIAVVGGPVSGPSVRDTIVNYEKYAALCAAHPFLTEPASWPADVRGLGGLVVGHSFRDAIASLIDAFTDGGMVSTARVFGRAANEPFSVVGDVNVKISFDSPNPEARISIEGEVYDLTLAGPDANLLDFMKERYSASVQYREIPPILNDEELEKWFRTRGHNYRGDLRQTRTITEDTLAEVAKLFGKTQQSVTSDADEQLN